MKASAIFAVGILLALHSQAARTPDPRPSGYQSEATGELEDFTCYAGDSTFSLTQLAAAKVKQQAASFIELNKDYRGCKWVDADPVLQRRNVDYVDASGGVSRFFLFEGKVACHGFLGLFPREMKIPRVVQYYSHASDPSRDRCL